MSLPHAILTALLEKPSSGLELTRRFDRSIGYFWPATHQQIYRELGRLDAAGLVRALPQPPARGRKKEYEVLPEGREALITWLCTAQDPRPVRDELFVRVRAAAALGPYSLADELRRHIGLHQARLAQYLEINQRDFPPDHAAAENRLQHLLLRGGVALERFWIEWLTEVLAAVDQQDTDVAPARETS